MNIVFFSITFILAMLFAYGTYKHITKGLIPSFSAGELIVTLIMASISLFMFLEAFTEYFY